MVSQAVMDYMNSFTDESLKKQPPELIITCREYLQKIFDRLVVSRRKQTYKFYSFWRGRILKLITSLETNWLGTAQGLYRGMQKSSSTTKDVRGVSSRRCPICQRNIRIRRSDALQLTGMPGVPRKDLTLFRCTMRSQQKWWFLSEADEEQLGTDRDIDYYQYKSKEDEELQPPPRLVG